MRASERSLQGGTIARVLEGWDTASAAWKPPIPKWDKSQIRWKTEKCGRMRLLTLGGRGGAPEMRI
jgi:hypothetical protein